MSSLKKVLWIFASINVMAGMFTVLTDSLWTDFFSDSLLREHPFLYDVFSGICYYFILIAPSITLAGGIVTTVFILRGLKKGEALKGECLMLGAFALSALFLTCILGLAIMRL